MINNCSVQLSDGSHCNRHPIADGKCFWHSDISKTDDSFKVYYQNYSSIKDLIQSEQPNLEKVIFSKGSLTTVNFSNLRLNGAQFYFTDLTGSQFIKANLTSAFFSNVNLNKANFTDANLDKAGFDKSDLIESVLNKASLVNTKIKDCNLSYASCIGTSFRSTKLVFSNLYKANFTNAKFSNRATQLKYCNIEEPSLENYLKNKTLDWVGSNERSDALKVIQFLSSKLEKKDFESWIRQISLSLKNAYESAREKSNFNQMADIYEFLARLYKTINYLPSITALPGKYDIPDNEPIIQLQANLLNNEIELSEFEKYCSQLNEFLIGFNQAISDRYIKSEKVALPKIIYISLQSPLEIWIIGLIGSSLLFIPKLISMWMDIFLKSIQIKKEQLELNGKEIALENIKIDNKLKLLDYRDKVMSEMNISEDIARKLTKVVDKHLLNIINLPTFVDYKITINGEEFILKQQSDKLEDKNNIQKLI